MKTKVLFSALLIFLATVSTYAAIRTVSNNTNSPGQFTTFAAAQSAANDGDTILIHGSPFNYNTFSVSKRLVLIGTGHNPQKQAPLKSTVDYINLYTGSLGTKIIGLDLYMIHTMNQHIDSIEIVLCKLSYQISIDQSLCNAWLIDGNVFLYTGDNISGACSQAGHLIRNNLFNGPISNFGNCQSNYHYIMNNIFLYSGNAFGNDFNFYIYNNIFYRANPTGASATYSNNISYQCGNNNFPNGVNQTNVDPKFVNFPSGGAYFDYSYDFNLLSGSPAKSAGNDGTDLGAYGGTGDFEQNGMPHNPQLTEFNISNPTIISGGTLNVNFKSKIR
ncbi:MAG: hypothetical protein JWO06_1872 [Bacteroidota bacterium]|nr:hypothetical protein [Bacteroidota bacterium]